MPMSVHEAEPLSIETSNRTVSTDRPSHLRLVGGTAIGDLAHLTTNEAPNLVEGPDISEVLQWVEGQIRALEGYIQTVKAHIKAIEIQIAIHEKELAKIDEYNEDLAPFSRVANEFSKRKVQNDAIDELKPKLTDWQNIEGMLQESLEIVLIEQEKLREKDFELFQATAPEYIHKPN